MVSTVSCKFFFFKVWQQFHQQAFKLFKLVTFNYDQLDAVYKILKVISLELVKEVNGKKVIEFTMPLPKFTMTPQ